MDAIKWLCKFLKGHWGKIIMSAVLTFLHVVAIFVTPYISGYLVDTIVSGEMFSGDTKRILTVAVALLIGGSLIRQLTWYIRQLVMEWVAQTTVMNIRGTLFERLQKLDFGFFNTNRTGDLMARMTGDMDAIRMVIANTFPYFLQQFLVFAVGVCTVFFVSPILGCSLMILVPGIIFLVFKMAKTNKPIFINMICLYRWRCRFLYFRTSCFIYPSLRKCRKSLHSFINACCNGIFHCISPIPFLYYGA